MNPQKLSGWFCDNLAVRSLAEVARRMTAEGDPISKSQVDRIEKRALRKLKAALLRIADKEGIPLP